MKGSRVKHIANLGAFNQHPGDTLYLKLVERNYLPVLIIALSVAIRIPALFSDFWLDELWSLSATQGLTSAVEVFTKLNSDNNHHLNSLFLYALGDQRYWELYRIPSILSGVAIVLLAWWIARPKGFLEAVLASTLTSFSYLLIHYSSEARGYSLAVMFSFAGFYALRRFADQRTWPWAIVFWGCTVLGTLAHLTYLYFFLAALIWLPLHQRKKQADGAPVVWPLVQAFCVPVTFLLLFYLTVIRHIVLQGIPYYGKLDILVHTLSLVGGGPPGGPAGVAVSLFVLLVLLAAILWHRRRNPPLGAFYLVVVIYPAILFSVREELLPRYVLVSVAFGLLALSGLLADFFRRGPAAKVLVVAVLALYMVGNGLYTEQLIRYGRGGYRSALLYMEGHTSGPVITVASNHYVPNNRVESNTSEPVITGAEDRYFPNRLLLKYYERFLQPGKSLAYYSGNEYPSNGTQWFLLDSFSRFDQTPFEFRDPHGNTYRLERQYPHSFWSGVTWHLYQRVQRARGRFQNHRAEATIDCAKGASTRDHHHHHRPLL